MHVKITKHPRPGRERDMINSVTKGSNENGAKTAKGEEKE